MNKHKAKLEGSSVVSVVFAARSRYLRRPRLRVTRTNANIYAQIIDDSKALA